MSDDSTTECLLFPGIFLKPVVAQFDQREGSSDGGALLLKAANQHYRLVEELTACLRDERQAGKVDHTLQDLVAQRVFSIACGYPDGNDSARLGGDPIHKLLLGRDPIEGLDLASQPTVSRFENAVGVKELYRMGETLARSVIRRLAKRLRRRVYRVTIDLDPTDDPTHGAQQLSFFECEVVRNVELAAPSPRQSRFPALSTPHFRAVKETPANRELWSLCSTECASDVEPV